MYEYRARCTRVVDGDTVDMEVDVGFRVTAKIRFRLLAVDTPELRDRDETERARAKEAKKAVEGFLLRDFDEKYPLKIYTTKADSFGRWLCRIMAPIGPTLTGGFPLYEDIGELLIQQGLAKRWED